MNEQQVSEYMEAMSPERRDEYMRLTALFHHVTDVSERPPEFLIEGFLPIGYCVILAGDPKIGKTSLASAIAVAVAEGSPFAGKEARRSGVLWLALEESPEERATVMQPALERLRDTTFYVSHCKIAIDTEDGLYDLHKWAKETEAKLIVVDPLHSAHSGRSLNDGWSARRTLEPFKKFCYRQRITGILLHHIGRGNNRVAENAQLAACAGMSLLYTRQQTPAGRLIKLQSAGRGVFANRTWLLGSDGPLNYWQEKPKDEQAAIPPKPDRFLLDDEVLACIEKCGRALSAVELGGELRRNPNSVRNALARLLAPGQIRVAAIHQNARYYDIFREPAPVFSADDDNLDDIELLTHESLGKPRPDDLPPDEPTSDQKNEPRESTKK